VYNISTATHHGAQCVQHQYCHTSWCTVCTTSVLPHVMVHGVYNISTTTRHGARCVQHQYCHTSWCTVCTTSVLPHVMVHGVYNISTATCNGAWCVQQQYCHTSWFTVCTTSILLVHIPVCEHLKSTESSSHFCTSYLAAPPIFLGLQSGHFPKAHPQYPV